jgi:hypothetical protein
MKTKIFAYKGHLGAETNIEEGKFINDPKSPGQLGVVVDIKEIEITKEAKEILKKAKKNGGSFSEVMLTRHADGNKDSVASIGLVGFYKHHFGKDVMIGRDCDTSIIDLMSDSEIEIPKDYKEFIDEQEK